MNHTDFERLRQSPLFQLSLASRELFHSNFLAWLFERHPDWVGPVLGTAPEHRHWRLGGKGVRREERNLDLVLHLDCGSTLIVENKVKSVPYTAQLARYETLVRASKQTYPDAHFLLLTLSPGDAPADASWPVLSYGQVGERLAQAAALLEPGYERSLVQDYAQFIQCLSVLGGIEGQQDWIDNRPELRDLRISDLLQKRSATWLARSLESTLREGGVQHMAEPGKRGTALEPGELLIYDGLTNGNGLVGFVLAICDGPKLPGARALPRYGIGVQLQGNQYRSFVQILRPDRPNKEAQEAFRKLCLRLFQESPLPPWWRPGDRGDASKELCTYGGTFMYRYRSLGKAGDSQDTRLQALADRLLASAKALVAGRAIIERALFDYAP